MLVAVFLGAAVFVLVVVLLSGVAWWTFLLWPASSGKEVIALAATERLLTKPAVVRNGKRKRGPTWTLERLTVIVFVTIWNGLRQTSSNGLKPK
jgi:hypothetical protein